MKRFLLLLLVLLLGWIVYERENLWAFPDIISAYTAKEYCSCRYVMNNETSSNSKKRFMAAPPAARV